jgi:membrane protease YdiL (CAAX protease family)
MSPPSFLWRHWNQNILEPLAQVDREARAFMASDASRRMDWKTAGVLVTAAVSLILSNPEYAIVPWLLAQLGELCATAGLQAVADAVDSVVFHSNDDAINKLTKWCAGCVGGYLVLPALVIRLGLGERLRDYGVKLRGAFHDWWIYVAMLLIMVPLVLLASTDKHFLGTYPFYQPKPEQWRWPSLWRWELLYALQFFALEFFFRGFMVHGLKHRFGAYSIFVMVVPYCMIHFGKPLPETLASIVAGIALGFMSLKTRSIWLGMAIHVSVALGMDFAALWRKGLL